MGGKKGNPLSAYAIVSQVGFMVIIPLVLFIWGGSWLVKRFELPDRLTIVFILLGIITMISSVGTYLRKIIKMYDNKEEREKTSPLSHDSRDHDW
ncbi:MAG: AtpZ/AtpI family protein [Firmicutes bacterium]|nr:AtpZ/AtpI family protein [[Eubacterium] siraeum]MCM1488659.1 AtpZ/AtpI family protein [Bacillota bacterium]